MKIFSSNLKKLKTTPQISFIRKTIIAIFLLLIFFSYPKTGVVVSNYLSLDLSEPVVGTYRSDEAFYLKSFYMLNRDFDYYPTLQTAFMGKADNVSLGKDVFTWRLPTVFIIWTLLARTGADVLGLFVNMGAIFIISIFFIYRKITNYKVGLLASLILIPYFFSIKTYPTAFLFTEWWALFFFSYGIAFFHYSKHWLAITFLLLAVFTRELLVLPVSIIIISMLVSKERKEYYKYLLIPFAFFILFFVHSQNISSITTGITTGETNLFQLLFSRFHQPTSETTYPMLVFFMQLYPFSAFKSYLYLITISFIGSVGMAIFLKNSKTKAFLISIWSMVFLFPFVITSEHTDYWSILWMPLVLSSIPAGLYMIFNWINKRFYLRRN